MSLVTTSNFRRAVLAFLQSTLDTYTLHLFVNNYTPLVTSVTANFTEPSGSWYSPIALVSWGTAFVNGSNQGEIDEVIRRVPATARFREIGRNASHQRSVIVDEQVQRVGV